MCGVNDDSIQWKLLSQGDLDLDKAWDIAQSMDSANRGVRDIQALWRDDSAAGRSKPVEQISDQQSTVLICCGCKGHHTPSDYRFTSETCHGCGRKGHIIRAC